MKSVLLISRRIILFLHLQVSTGSNYRRERIIIRMLRQILSSSNNNLLPV